MWGLSAVLPNGRLRSAPEHVAHSSGVNESNGIGSIADAPAGRDPVFVQFGNQVSRFVFQDPGRQTLIMSDEPLQGAACHAAGSARIRADESAFLFSSPIEHASE